MSARSLRLAARSLSARRSVVLCYHGVGPSTARTDPGYLRVRPDAFRAQLELLLGAGFRFVSVSEFASRCAGDAPPAGLAVLSFDDGMDDNHDVVLPILAELRLPATVYVVTGLIGKPNPWMGRESGARMMNHEELRELVAGGVEIGAHTITHPDLSRLAYDACLHEMDGSRRELENLLAVSVKTFAYPFCRYGPAARLAVERAGFEAAVTCQGLGSWDRFELKRSLITGKDELPMFLLKLTDAYQPLFDSLPGRAVRSSTRAIRDHVRRRKQRRRSRGSS
ncbi:MAG TPA: polysaccharide deacetylase family protein [Gaiellaceae bacterium]|nr:polysaccharide deacetylase family protein [Gaiellaceae bacterium]